MADLARRKPRRKTVRATATIEELAGLATQLEMFAELPPLPAPAERDVRKLPEVRRFLRAVAQHFGPPAEIKINRRARRRERMAVSQPAPQSVTAKETEMKKSEAFPSRFFKAVDLDHAVVAEIDGTTRERLENLEGKVEEKTIVQFANHQKHLVLNVTNWDAIVDITGEPDTDDWPGHRVELYRDKTHVGNRQVDCIRIRKPRPPGTGAEPGPKKPASRIETSPRRMKEQPLPDDGVPASDGRDDQDIPF